MMKRETAWRVFAGEYNDSTLETRGEEERAPSYVITPLGAKVNRLFVVGVLTDVENITESGELLRAHVSDPTGIFTLYTGQYNPEATKALSEIDVPAFVSIVGKSRTYEPEEGVLYVSIRPEIVREVDEQTRDRWILETCEHTKERIEATHEVTKTTQPNAYDLHKLGYTKELSNGVIDAVKHYKNTDVSKYLTMIVESLHYLTPPEEGMKKLPEIEKKEKVDTLEQKETTEEKKKEVKGEDKDNKSDEAENTLLTIIKQIEGKEGAPWDTIIEKGADARLEKDIVEETLTSLMDKGLIYEPILGTIKTT